MFNESKDYCASFTHVLDDLCNVLTGNSFDTFLHEKILSSCDR